VCVGEIDVKTVNYIKPLSAVLSYSLAHSPRLLYYIYIICVCVCVCMYVCMCYYYIRVARRFTPPQMTIRSTTAAAGQAAKNTR